MTKKVIVALYNMGGPKSLDHVESFLRELFYDPDLLAVPAPLQKYIANDIIKKRLSEVKENYSGIGGKSPQMDITWDLCKKVWEKRGQFPQNNYEVVEVKPLFRYCEPRAQTILDECLEKKCDEVWMFSQYPHCTRATTGTNLREVALLKANNPKYKDITVRSIFPWWTDLDIQDIWAKRIKKCWDDIKEPKKHLVISAHSIPKKYLKKGDPYAQQISTMAREVAGKCGLEEGKDWTLSWQSKVGPLEWLSPDTVDASLDLVEKGYKHMLYWPISFVGDHIETISELDIELKEELCKAGIEGYSRVPNLNSDDEFADWIAKTIEKGLEEVADDGTHSRTFRNIETHEAHPSCKYQNGGCLCARFYDAGLRKENRKILTLEIPHKF